MMGIFDGEEFARAARLFTHGYDLYTPNENIIFHGTFLQLPSAFRSSYFNLLNPWPRCGRMHSKSIELQVVYFLVIHSFIHFFFCLFVMYIYTSRLLSQALVESRTPDLECE